MSVPEEQWSHIFLLLDEAESQLALSKDAPVVDDRYEPLSSAVKELTELVRLFFVGYDLYSDDFLLVASKRSEELRIRLERLQSEVAALRSEVRVSVSNMNKGQKGINAYKKV